MTDNKTVRTISIDELMEQDKREKTGMFQEVGPLGSSGEVKNRLDPSLNRGKIRKNNRYYLPVLRINDPDMWESIPRKDRRNFTDKVASETCLTNCCGVPGLKNACCQLDPEDLEHVLGPVKEKWIKRAIKWYHKKGMTAITRHDLVIDIEEGKLIGEAHFNGHEIFNNEGSYPMMRIQANGQRFSCKNLNVESGMCTIYEMRPDMCSGYYCQFVKTNFFLKVPGTQNKWHKADTETKDTYRKVSVKDDLERPK